MGSRIPLPQLTMGNDPLRTRPYLHFDEPPRRSVIAAAVADPAHVARWEFLPLITQIKVIRKIKRQGTVFTPKPKLRPISYASHHDAALYAYYSAKLTKQYEQRLHTLGLSEVVTAFRTGDGRCNIHFAREAFEWIKTHRPCVALAYDISGFFDNLNHRILRDKWADIIKERSLPADHYAIYRSLTRYSAVQQTTLFATFGISIHSPKASGRTRVCTPNAFRTRIADAGHIEVHQLDKGIPQGTPISATLSNIYMLDFDRKVAEQIAAWGGLYRRYCDDVLCIVPPEHAVEAKAFIEALVTSIKLEVQPEKLEECAFGAPGTTTKPALQYLGLTYDGRKVRLRSGGVARFYNRIRKGVRQAKRARAKAARVKGVSLSSVAIKRGKLNRSYLYAGPRNYVSYATRAARLTKSDAIQQQIARRTRALDDAIKGPEADE
ncbi:hypothetical protein EKH79_03520 [Dyella dinghuensis]|uniref:Reverse transcriptase domain-containing protein n=1 Tax=Dyella dinghuensis TaxID=1920169 RepID=A0A3S0RUD2_9GAMM|nr:antiviral reverse transcriptase Drt2 [Dyella dinghuensis]RUL65794.1 hypothetical protein EKH79_03520 [Dyella dinghuensis]